MDFTKIECINESCNHIKMVNAGAQLGGRINIMKVKCPKCNLSLMIVPMKEEYMYSVSATTSEERKDKLIEEAKKESELELARKIIQIKEGKY